VINLLAPIYAKYLTKGDVEHTMADRFIVGQAAVRNSHGTGVRLASSHLSAKKTMSSYSGFTRSPS
jgi:hypothetical protein